jgi:hypothetical protein
MTPYKNAVAAWGTALDAVDRVIAVGSPEAIADCRRRLRDMQRAAQAAIDAPDWDQDVADRLVNGAASDGEDYR